MTTPEERAKRLIDDGWAETERRHGLRPGRVPADVRYTMLAPIAAAIRAAVADVLCVVEREADRLVSDRRAEPNPHNPPGFDAGYECGVGDLAANVRAAEEVGY